MSWSYPTNKAMQNCWFAATSVFFAVPIEDSSLMEYMESAAPEELYEKLPGSRQVTLLVFREGDQLNFFRVVDRGDGTLTPLSESLR